jgi:hypothetical protein
LKPRFTFISHGVGWKRGAILRRSEERKTRKKAEKRAILRSAEHRACGVVGRVRASAIDAAEARRLARGCCGFVSAGLVARF